MARQVELPPDGPPEAGGIKAAGWWHEDDVSGRVVCEVCPRECVLGPDDRGFCFVRQNRAGRMVSTTYGRSTGFCIDPIEKKPLHQFYPGTAVLSFGTAGCNLGCRFCQNWTSSKSREVDRFCQEASPEAIAQAARQLQCKSVAFTYNDPIVWVEYAIDTARACREAGVKTVAVTSGYMNRAARKAFYPWIDAANVDLKAFDDEFYHKLCAGRLEPVLDTLRWLVHETDVWVEITNLIIPRENDSPEAIRRLCDWVAEELRPDVPVHFSAFHPDFRMTDRDPTPLETLVTAHELARAAGLSYVYTGNVPDPSRQATYCPACGRALIERDGYELGVYALKGDRCGHCGAAIAGRFDAAPGNWGSRRQPVRIADFAVEQHNDANTETTARAAANRKEEHHPMSGDKNPSSALPETPVQPALTERQEQQIFRAAVAQVVATVNRSPVEAEALPAELADWPLLGAFVTLKRAGQLRSCCGFMADSLPLGEAVEHAAVRAAKDDPRFPPISPSELEYLDVDVWLLWGMKPVAERGEGRISAIEIGRHGLQIQRGGHRGLLLPGVAVEHRLDAEGFLRQVCLKASLPPEAWREDDTILHTFEGHAIEGPLSSGVSAAALAESFSEAPGGPSRRDLDQLVEFCRVNLAAMLRSATPTYYLPGGFDGTIHGLSLTVAVSGDRQSVQCGRLSVKPGMPLQSTLFSILQAAVEHLRESRVEPNELTPEAVGLTILWDPALHGATDAPDWKGFDVKRRAVVVMSHSGWAWTFDPARSVEELFEETKGRLSLSEKRPGPVLSLAAVSNEPRAWSASAPPPEAPRPAAVAGLFYPGDPAEMDRQLDALLGEPVAKEAWPGAMVPHAGWKYSGRLAADVLRRIAFPRRVLLFSPKHKAVGADWAVAPQSVWNLPGRDVASDPELAQALAEAVDGFELDAAAHRPEHAIEVELPLVARLAPKSSVVGVAMHGGEWPELKECATQLAAFLKTLPEAPLLLISTDMNHFADDATTRRVDRMALEAIHALDPERLLRTVRENRIRMCGVVPAVVVMETLRQLGRLSRCEEVGYATSAEATGDTAQVVGYAGMLFA